MLGQDVPEVEGCSVGPSTCPAGLSKSVVPSNSGNCLQKRSNNMTQCDKRQQKAALGRSFREIRRRKGRKPEAQDTKLPR